MKILLISFNYEISPYPVMPLGLYYIRSYLQKSSIDSDIIDLYLEKDFKTVIERHIKENNYSACGISIRNIDNILYPYTISYIDEIKSLIEFIRKISSLPIILGGSGYSIFPDKMLRYCKADYGIKGEGESALLSLLNNLKDPQEIRKIPNIYLSNEIHNKNCIPENNDFIFSYPERDSKLTIPYIKTGGMINIQLKRGCPFECIYCTYPEIDGKTLRIRDSMSIIDEIQYLKDKFNFDYFYFVDSIFNYPVKETKDFLRLLKERNLNIKWTGFFNPKFIDSEILQLTLDTGCDEIEFGTESGSNKILHYLKKGFTKEDIKKAKDLSDDLGIKTMFYLMIGSPIETKETIEESIEFFQTLAPDAIVVMLGIRIYPNTPLYESYKKDYNISLYNDLLNPIFYIKEDILEYSKKRFSELSRTDARWIVPSLKINYYPEKLISLRKFGSKGPLWSKLKTIKPHKK